MPTSNLFGRLGSGSGQEGARDDGEAREYAGSSYPSPSTSMWSLNLFDRPTVDLDSDNDGPLYPSTGEAKRCEAYPSTRDFFKARFDWGVG